MKDLIKNILWPEYPRYPNTRISRYEELPVEGLTMGTLFIGKQGSGKTTSLSQHIVEDFKNHPGRARFVLDSKGSNTDAILARVAQEPDWVQLSRRIIVDELGNPNWTVPLPEFSHMYGMTFDEQAHRVGKNLENLNPDLMSGAPFVAGLAFQETAPQEFRLLTAIANERGETFQITEARQLLTNLPALRSMVAKYGATVPGAKDYFNYEYFPLSQHEKELRTNAIRSALGPLESPEIRARLGYPRPGWTPREAIKEGLMVIVDGSRLTNRKSVQNYLFTQIFSMIMSEINKRHPADPKDEPISLVLDEVYSLMKIPSMAPEIAELAPQYRNRKLQLYVVLQELEQMSKELRPHIWSLGNIVSFGLSNFNEAYEMAQQLFTYDPKTIKREAVSDTGQPVSEPDRGQFLQIANDIQRLKHRECIIRRYYSEKQMDTFVQWVKKTKDLPNNRPYIDPIELKERLIRKRAVRVRDALEIVDQRLFRKSEGKKKAEPRKL